MNPKELMFQRSKRRSIMMIFLSKMSIEPVLILIEIIVTDSHFIVFRFLKKYLPFLGPWG